MPYLTPRAVDGFKHYKYKSVRCGRCQMHGASMHVCVHKTVCMQACRPGTLQLPRQQPSCSVAVLLLLQHRLRIHAVLSQLGLHLIQQPCMQNPTILFKMHELWSATQMYASAIALHGQATHTGRS